MPTSPWPPQSLHSKAGCGIVMGLLLRLMLLNNISHPFHDYGEVNLFIDPLIFIIFTSYQANEQMENQNKVNVASCMQLLVPWNNCCINMQLSLRLMSFVQG